MQYTLYIYIIRMRLRSSCNVESATVHIQCTCVYTIHTCSTDACTCIYTYSCVYTLALVYKQISLIAPNPHENNNTPKTFGKSKQIF